MLTGDGENRLGVCRTPTRFSFEGGRFRRLAQLHLFHDPHPLAVLTREQPLHFIHVGSKGRMILAFRQTCRGGPKSLEVLDIKPRVIVALVVSLVFVERARGRDSGG